ncbi:MAG: nickel-dependent lactate racemase [bacterium]|nr:nickel-dependent lactate racemase [bacterium]
MNLSLPYGTGTIDTELNFGRVLDTLDVADTPAVADTGAAAREALEHPIGQDRTIFETVSPGETATIVVSDSFRKTKVDKILPVLLDGLTEAGVAESDIRFLFATGTHRGPTPDEQAQILGKDVCERFAGRLFIHDAHDADAMVHVGRTSRGTEVRLNRIAVDADRLIVTGAVVLHYFGGFGGGRKSILPGISSVDSIAHNHAMNLHPTEDRLDAAVRIGALDGNPVAEDMQEAAGLVKVDCMVNTVLNRQGRIAAVFAGDLEAAHRRATKFAFGLFAVTIGERADIVIAASGPTKNYVQTHKALYNAYQAVKPTGRIVLAARCEEGPGGDQFLKWARLGSREAIMAGLRRQSEINGQTALSTVEKAPLALMVTDLDDEQVGVLGARKAGSLDDALDTAREELSAAGISEPTVYVMPSAAYTVPFLTG